MKLTMAIKKHNKGTVGQIAGHNKRKHDTASQLPNIAWFTDKGAHQVAKWNSKPLETAKGIAKRKDAVLAVEVILQVGSQSDWRELPTDDHPHGKPKAGAIPLLKKLHQAVIEVAGREFGHQNIISIDIHTDESTPHAHLIFTPIHEGNLQAKHWLDGPATLGQLRERVHKIVNAVIPCTYEKYGIGGAAHDPGKAAGVAPVPSSGLFGKLKGAVSNTADLDAAKQLIKAMEAEKAILFSKLKREIQTSTDRLAVLSTARLY